jgi:ribosomal protein S18 acetylase RimI-like enzyme
MINLQVRRATPQDHYQISNLLFHESHTHRHLDWRSVLEWIGTQNFWVLDEHGFVSAAFACPEDPPNVAWIRLFTYHPHHNADVAWSALWSNICNSIFYNNPNICVSAIVLKPWFQNILLQNSFEQRQNIVLLKMRIGNFALRTQPAHIHIRPMTELDFSAVASLDLQAFGPFWHNTLDSLQRAYAQAIYATVAENDSKIIGYQISTGNHFGAHLARLAVVPEAQGQGVASALVSNLLQKLSLNPNGNLSVNTQDDNFSSLALYQKMGFTKTGEHFPVLTFQSKKQ